MPRAAAGAMDYARLMRSPLGGLVFAPWFDAVAARAIADWYFPLSRAWAAAITARGAITRFAAESGAPPHPAWIVRGAVAETARRWRRYEAANARFEDAFFGAPGAAPGALRAAQEAREAKAQDVMAARGLFVAAHVMGPFPAVRFDIAERTEVERRHGARLAAPASAFAPPQAPPAPQRSATVAGRDHTTFWLRFPAPVESLGDMAWARVAVPSEAKPRACLIFTHGLAMETEFWRGLAGPPSALTEGGIVLIRPEGPYHGRRRTKGHYGGEDLVARGLLGLLDYFHAHVIELGLLVAWARHEFGVPVAVGGVSLGALAAQRAALASRHWPAALRPDGLFLVTPSASITTAALTGSLPRAMGVPAALRDAGWDDESLARFASLIEGEGLPPVDPGRIVATLGARDDITPHAEGLRLVRAWRVPAANVFARPRGHYSTSLALLRDPTPFLRLAEVLGQGG
jgi:hypothetical protein